MKTVPLGEIAQLGSGGTPKRSVDEYFGPGTPWMSIADLNDGTVYGAKESLTDSGLANSSAKVVTPGTILLAMYGSIGKLAIAGVPLCTSQAIAFIRPDPRKVDRDFLFHYLRAQRPHLQANGRGGTQMNISQGDLKKWPVPLPPLDEQQRIAAILDQTDEVRNNRGRVMTRFDELAPAIFLDMFGGYTGDFVTVEQIAEQQKGSIRTGPFGSQLLHNEFVDEGIAVLGLDNVVGNAFGWGERRYITPEKYQGLRRYTVRPGDVLVSIMGTCGRCVVVPQDVGIAINTKHICAITVDPDRAVPEFVRAAFLWHPRSRQHLSQRTKGSIMDGLNMGIVKEMPLPLPLLSEQRHFAARLRQVEGQQAACLKSAASLDRLFCSLQGRAFAGQL